MKKFPKWKIKAILNIVNEKLFDNMLDVNNIKVKQKKRDKHIAAWYWDNNIIIYRNFHNNAAELMDTIAHELIHHYQDILDIPMNHNGKFFKHYAKKYSEWTGISMSSFKGNFANLKKEFK